ncbi:hypothetical protein A2803_04395 [Candidatus Woesebacteria bacterium RIFCSPHIGHO2_01_FULL_44_21]|uniref:Uncharacterized protein n=1 Tax=Candidatus Woesebacteria bacterium RIFCSPHIGHO2_01_FULL_44_21 TaxID=1802503 RepID=A0A1F7Z1Q4_9BACT|nr:MAG: hypothetical protein A2803_04395 [Candidatus Woesebacteria bacterium RIFCSPHIGHO2_01_FULL_44_21]
MRIAVGIFSFLYLLVSLWVIIFELPRYSLLAQELGKELPFIVYVYPFVFLGLGVIGLTRTFTRKLPNLKLSYLLIIEILTPPIIVIIGALTFN